MPYTQEDKINGDMAHDVSDIIQGRIHAAARCAHEANRVYCELTGDTPQPAWDDAPAWQTASCVDGVNAIVYGRVTSPQQSHENWLRVKEADGWKYGLTKNPDKKEHPCVAPFDKLPTHQQLKDIMFFSIVKAMTDGITVMSPRGAV